MIWNTRDRRAKLQQKIQERRKEESNHHECYWNLLCSSQPSSAIRKNCVNAGAPFDQDYNGLPQSAAKAASIMSTPDSMSLSHGPRRDRYRWLTTNMRRTLRRNIAVADYEGMPTSSSSFALFPKFPPKIRCRIWRHALHRPRIAELEVLPSSHQDPWMLQCWPKNPPNHFSLPVKRLEEKQLFFETSKHHAILETASWVQSGCDMI